VLARQMLYHLNTFYVNYFRIIVLLYAWAVLNHDPRIHASLIAGKMCGKHHANLLVEVGSFMLRLASNLFPPDFYLTSSQDCRYEPPCLGQHRIYECIHFFD
jgi:hypothetical protein